MGEAVSLLDEASKECLGVIHLSLSFKIIALFTDERKSSIWCREYNQTHILGVKATTTINTGYLHFHDLNLVIYYLGDHFLERIPVNQVMKEYFTSCGQLCDSY